MRRTLVDALILAKKDLMLLKRNRTAIFLSLILLPSFFMGALVSTQGQESMEIQTQFVPVAVVDEDITPLSSSFRQALGDSDRLGRIVDTSSRISGEQLLREGKVAAVIVIPKGFADSVKSGNEAAVLVILDDSKPGIPNGAYDTVVAIAQEYSVQVDFERTRNTRSPLLDIINRGRPVNMLTIGIGIILGFVQVFACFYEVAGGMVRERETDTFPRLILARASNFSIVLGKTIYSSLLTLARGVVVMAIAIYAYGAAIYGDISLAIFVSWMMGLTTMGLALLLAASRVSGRTVVISEFLLVIVLFAFAGLIRDRDLMTGSGLLFSSFLPWTYGFDALRKTIILNWGLERILPDLGILALYSVVFYASALLLFHLRKETLIA